MVTRKFWTRDEAKECLIMLKNAKGAVSVFDLQKVAMVAKGHRGGRENMAQVSRGSIARGASNLSEIDCGASNASLLICIARGD
jgi:hypothetical protein